MPTSKPGEASALGATPISPDRTPQLGARTDPPGAQVQKLQNEPTGHLSPLQSAVQPAACATNRHLVRTVDAQIQKLQNEPTGHPSPLQSAVQLAGPTNLHLVCTVGAHVQKLQNEPTGHLSPLQSAAQPLPEPAAPEPAGDGSSPPWPGPSEAIVRATPARSSPPLRAIGIEYRGNHKQEPQSEPATL